MSPDEKPSAPPDHPQTRPSFDETTGFAPPDTSVDSERSSIEAIAPEAWIGRTLGKYEIVAVLGRGAMGTVFKARDPLIERDVAIKLLHDELAADQRALARFLAEAKAAGKLNHPHVAAIYEIGEEDGRHYLVMEYAGGGSVGDQLEKRGALTALDATKVISDVCRGVAAAHAAGMIHRDIKPANFLHSHDGTVKVTDFGLAKSTTAATHQLTQMGLVVGTPVFMSPEQCEARPVDARSDIYSLGATYYSLLTGRNPYDNAESVPQLLYSHCHGPIPDPRDVVPSVPAACARIVARAMAKSPDDRYQSVGEMLADLQAVAATLSGDTLTALPSESGITPVAVPRPAVARPRRQVSMWGALVGLVALLAIGMFFWRPWQTAEGDAGGAIPGVVAGEPIKVGILHSLSGTMATSESVVVDATLFAIEEINQSGGLLGRPIEAVVADGRSDPAHFAREAKRLISEENVCTVFGTWTSASRKTVKPVFEEHDHLLIYPVQYEGLEVSPNIIYLGAVPNQQIFPAIDWAVNELGRKRLFLVGSDYVFPRTANAVIRDYCQSLPVEIVGEEYLPLGTLDVVRVVEAIKAAQPDLILNTINGDTNTVFFRALRAAGIKPPEVPTLSFSVGEQELRSLSAADVAGDYASWNYFQSIDSPENAEFVRRFQHRYPQRSITDPMEAAYIGVKLWAQAVEEAGSLEPKKIRRAMLNERLDAPGGAIRIDPDTQHAFETPRIGRIGDDGHFEIVWSATEPVAPEPFPASRTAADWKGFLHDLYTGWGNQWSAP